MPGALQVLETQRRQGQIGGETLHGLSQQFFGLIVFFQGNERGGLDENRLIVVGLALPDFGSRPAGFVVGAELEIHQGGEQAGIGIVGGGLLQFLADGERFLEIAAGDIVLAGTQQQLRIVGVEFQGLGQAVEGFGQVAPSFFRLGQQLPVCRVVRCLLQCILQQHHGGIVLALLEPGLRIPVIVCGIVAVGRAAAEQEQKEGKQQNDGSAHGSVPSVEIAGQQGREILQGALQGAIGVCGIAGRDERAEPYE